MLESYYVKPQTIDQIRESWVGPEIERYVDWLAHDAHEHAGSWWPLWMEWLTARSGASKPAPKTLGSRKHPAGDPAPGTYVFDV